MGEKIALLLVGFILTTIAGGLLGTLFQHRSWRYKWEMENSEKKISTAKDIFQEISRLMDRRLYRVYQFYLWVKRNDKSKIEETLKNYREIVAEWNDNINRHLSMLQIHFGSKIRENFDFRVGKRFVEAGATVEAYYRNMPGNDKAVEIQIDNDIEQLRSMVYNYNLEMLAEIETMTYRASVEVGIIRDLKKLFFGIG